MGSNAPRSGFPSTRRPAFQITHIQGPHSARRQPELPGHAPYRRTLTGQPYRLFKALAERRFARQLRHLLRLHSAIRAANAVELDHHRGAKFEAGQIPHLPFVGVVHFAQLPPTPGTDQFPIPSFSPYPQLQRFSGFVDFVAIDPIPGPPQHSGPVCLPHPAKCTQSSSKSKPSFNLDTLQIPAQSHFSLCEPVNCLSVLLLLWSRLCSWFHRLLRASHFCSWYRSVFRRDEE